MELAPPEGMQVICGKTVDYVQRRPAYEAPLIVCTDGTVIDTGDWLVVRRGDAR